ncbi:MAG: CxxH/CxxC protein [Ectobacillus sp.]
MDISCCQEHVELALDIIVDEFETAPVIHNINNTDEQEKTCEYCQNRAIYVVSNENSPTTCG